MPTGIYKRIIGLNYGFPNQGFQKGQQSLRKGKHHTLKTKELLRNANLGKKQSLETIGKRAFQMRGEKNPLYRKMGELHPKWIKDRNLLKKEFGRRSSAYKNWKKQIEKRDNSKCRIDNQECKGRIESHHIFNWIDYPELRFIINNGITLCHFHHPRKWEEEKRMIPIFQELIISKSSDDVGIISKPLDVKLEDIPIEEIIS